jgi:CheY-like chemotaxis protein
MSHKLLVADDSVTIQRVIELTFADEDIEVIAVGDGLQAIQRIEADHPDIILVDVSMPERDGYQVASFVKKSPHLGNIPVILLTGAFEPVDEAEARRAGCDGVLAKPFEPQAVITRVRELLSARAAALAPAAAEAGWDGRGTASAVPEAALETAEGEFLPSERLVEESMADQVREATAEEFPTGHALREMIASQPGGAGISGHGEDILEQLHEEVDGERNPEHPVGTGQDSQKSRPLAEGPDETLDDYFDRLDAEFGSAEEEAAAGAAPGRTQASVREALSEPPRAQLGAEDMERALDAVDFVDHDAFSAFPSEPAQPEPSTAAPLEPERWMRDTIREPAPERPTPPVGRASGLMSDRRAPAEPIMEAPRTAPAPRPPAEPPQSGAEPAPLADAFAALLAAEQGGAAPEPPPLPDEFVDQVTERVLERLAERITRDTVTDMVLVVAERLVRQELDRLKASAP